MKTRGRTAVLCIAAMTVLCGCGAQHPTGTDPSAVAAPSPTPSSTPVDPAVEEAQQRADQWLETASVPPEAVRVDGAKAAFSSYQGWVCTPTVTETGFWTIEGMSVVEVANWLIDHPTPGLIAHRSHLDPERATDGVLIGEVPQAGALEGLVFTVQSMPDGGVALRAEIGAEAADATCPTPPGGGQWGEPGMG